MKLYNTMLNLFAAMSTSEIIEIFRYIFIAILALCAIALIVLILLQPAASEGLGTISGQSYDSFYSKNKVHTREGIMKRLTIVISIVVVLISIAYFITGIWYTTT